MNTVDQVWKQRAAHIAAGRYADDTSDLSRTTCRQCLITFLRTTYHGLISFDFDDKYTVHADGTVEHRYLDCAIFFSMQSWELLLIHPNEKYAFSGQPEFRKKFAVRPFDGCLRLVLFQHMTTDQSYYH